MLRQALRQTAANARQLCIKEQILGQGNIIRSQAPIIAQETVAASACRALCSHSSIAHHFSTKAEQQQSEETTAQEDSGSSQEQAAGAEQDAVDPKDQLLAERDQQVAEYKDKLVRVLADMENLRDRTTRQAEQSRQFAIQGFVKSLLDVADNLERAAGSVTEESLQGLASDGKKLTVTQSQKLLKGLLDGVTLTDRILIQALKQNGVEKFSPLGDKFDPNIHSALFQIPDAQKEAGTVLVVTKSGYTLNGRVVRPAEVGVSTQP